MTQREPMHIISLGAGVQSSTMALMAAAGEITPMPTAAIFADTQWEPRAVYDWLDWLEPKLPFPVLRVTHSNLRDDALRKQNSTGGRYAPIPWHMMMPDGTHSMGRRQCTREYKLDPIKRAKRGLLGYVPRARIPLGSCVTWIGISTDEAQRMKPSRDVWSENRWPLIDAGMSRDDCLRWMDRNGFPRPPKSSCLGCPYHSDQQWREIKANPAEWADVVAVDAAIRDPARGIRGKQYMHRSMRPLAEVDLRTAEDAGQMSMFGAECEGICGT
jgi:hypothetical protein